MVELDYDHNDDHLHVRGREARGASASQPFSDGVSAKGQTGNKKSGNGNSSRNGFAGKGNEILQSYQIVLIVQPNSSPFSEYDRRLRQVGPSHLEHPIL